MLRVTVELMPGGGLQGRRTLATAEIGRIRSGALADYQIDMEEHQLEAPWSGTLQDYAIRSRAMNRQRKRIMLAIQPFIH